MFRKLLSIIKKLLIIVSIGMLLFFGIPIIKNIYTYQYALHIHNYPLERVEGRQGELMGIWQGYFDYFPCGVHTRRHYYVHIEEYVNTETYTYTFNGQAKGKMIKIHKNHDDMIGASGCLWLDWGRDMEFSSMNSFPIKLEEGYLKYYNYEDTNDGGSEMDSTIKKIRYKYENDQLYLNVAWFEAGLGIEKSDALNPDWRTSLERPEFRKQVLNVKDTPKEWRDLWKIIYDILFVYPEYSKNRLK